MSAKEIAVRQKQQVLFILRISVISGFWLAVVSSELLLIATRIRAL